MKYVSATTIDIDPDKRTWRYDDFGNKVDKITGEFVILSDSYTENVRQQPMGLVKVNNQWVPKQMEFDFG